MRVEHTARGTGRTARMLRAAHSAAARGRKVVIVGATQSHVEELRARHLERFPNDRAWMEARLLRFVHAEQPSVFDFYPYPHVIDGDADYAVMVDHYAAELEAADLRVKLRCVEQLAHHLGPMTAEPRHGEEGGDGEEITAHPGRPGA